MNYQEIEGDLIVLAFEGRFDVIAHGCNCFCRMRRGLAPQMAKAFGCDNPFVYSMEAPEQEGEINKLGQIEYSYPKSLNLAVVNCYTQYHWETSGKPLDYNALALCLTKINHEFRGKKVGLPQIGCHLAGGDWTIVRSMIKEYLKDCEITIVIYKP